MKVNDDEFEFRRAGRLLITQLSLMGIPQRFSSSVSNTSFKFALVRL